MLLVDLQDLGTRVYTFVTTLRYVLEAAARLGKAVWVLDRPNPIGRPVEGLLLKSGWESFVGAGPMPMRHGRTLGELGAWLVQQLKLDLEYVHVAMDGWRPAQSPGYGWPLGERAWINPSPNAPSVSMARCYPGTVMVEGTTLSEGRGTTRPLELFGAPDLDADKLLANMRALAPDWLAGCRAAARAGSSRPSTSTRASSAPASRSTWTIPATTTRSSGPGGSSRSPSRRSARSGPTTRCGAISPYEYETTRLAIDLINGGPTLREWVDDPAATPGDLDELARQDENEWQSKE